jgi:hypothetical protein
VSIPSFRIDVMAIATFALAVGTFLLLAEARKQRRTMFRPHLVPITETLDAIAAALATAGHEVFEGDHSTPDRWFALVRDDLRVRNIGRGPALDISCRLDEVGLQFLPDLAPNEEGEPRRNLDTFAIDREGSRTVTLHYSSIEGSSYETTLLIATTRDDGRDRLILRDWSTREIRIRRRSVKRALAVAIALSVGVVAGASLALAVISRQPTKPRPWNRSAITADFDEIQAPERNLVFYYTLENSSDLDFVIQRKEDMHLGARLKRPRQSLSFGNIIVQTDLPLFVPSKQRVRFGVRIDYPYSGDDPLPTGHTEEERQRARAILAQFARTELTNLAGFALFCEPDRYEIDLPNGWNK